MFARDCEVASYIESAPLRVATVREAPGEHPSPEAV